MLLSSLGKHNHNAMSINYSCATCLNMNLGETLDREKEREGRSSAGVSNIFHVLLASLCTSFKFLPLLIILYTTKFEVNEMK